MKIDTSIASTRNKEQLISLLIGTSLGGGEHMKTGNSCWKAVAKMRNSSSENSLDVWIQFPCDELSQLERSESELLGTYIHI